MPIFVVLLRGINVGKHRRVAMADIRTQLAAAGYDHVTTYLQSGNLILESRERRPTSVGSSIEDVLRTALDLDIEVVVRTAGQLGKVAASNPFLDRDGVDPASLHVAFLKSKPATAAARALAGAQFGDDEFLLQGSELYLRYPDGLGRSKMTAAFFERTLSSPATIRNWRVVTKLAELASAAR